MPLTENNKFAIHVDPTLRKTNMVQKSDLFRELPEVLGMDVSWLSAGSNVNNQRMAATYGHAFFTDAIGGYWDIGPGGFIVRAAGGVATDINGNSITKDTKSVAIGSANEEIHEKLLEIVSRRYKGYVDFKVGVVA